MSKRYIFIFGFLLFSINCIGDRIELNRYEKELAKGHANITAQLLIRKAILKEAQKTNYSKQDKLNLDLAKEEVEVNFFLQKKIGEDKNLKVSEAEVKKFYDEHSTELVGKKYEDVKLDIANLILLEKQNQALSSYYTDLVKKYKLDDILINEYPELKIKVYSK